MTIIETKLVTSWFLVIAITIVILVYGWVSEKEKIERHAVEAIYVELIIFLLGVIVCVWI